MNDAGSTNLYRSILVVTLAVLFSGCLKTRSQLKGETGRPPTARQTQTQQVQAGQAREVKPKDPNYRFDEIDEELRRVHGRIENVEASLEQIRTAEQTAQTGEAERRQADEKRLQ